MEKLTVEGVPFERWTVGASTYETCLTRGARLMRWKLNLPTGTREVLHWPAGADFAQDKIGLVRGGNPILFPFMGRNYADGEKFFWKDSAGVKRPMPQHGFARDSAFELIESSDRHALLRMISNDRAVACYPFKYEFRVRYEFHELFVRCTFEFENLDTQPLPWCAGHHFYFTLPWHAGLSRRDYVIKIPSKKQWRHAADGKLVPFADLKGKTELSFDDPGLPDCIFTHLKDALVVFGPKSGEENISVKVGEEPIPDGWAALVTWTPDGEAPFYCVEPWMGPPNSTEHKNGLRFAEPGRTETFVTEVTLL